MACPRRLAARLERAQTVNMESRQDQIEREERYLRQFQRQADEICHLIVNTDLPFVDIAIQIERLRRETERLYPRKLPLFEMVYRSRFKRLWQQWRPADDPWLA